MRSKLFQGPNPPDDARVQFHFSLGLPAQDAVEEVKPEFGCTKAVKPNTWSIHGILPVILELRVNCSVDTPKAGKASTRPMCW